MLIGVPLETAAGETRVAVTPETAKKLKAQGHVLRVQSGAGVAASATDEAYVAAGAEIVDRVAALGADLVLKVRAPLADVVVTTALIPGRAAPVLVTEDMVKSMKPGSVIVDIAAGRGASGIDGNCPLTEAGRTVVKHGVTIVGETNLPALVAADSSSLYARNVLDFLKLVVDKEAAFKLDLEDDIVAACLMSHQGEVKRK